MSSVRALRAENARLESRLEKLEAQLVTGPARAAAPPKPTVVASGTTSATATSSVDALPPLAVVKLKPKREAAPKISTAVEVSEPPETIVQEFQAPSAPTQGTAGDPSVADAEFESALSLLKTGNADEGVKAMLQFVTDWPHHPKADNALYFVGLAAMSGREFDQAAGHFERVLAQYPAGDAVLDSMLKLADCRVRLNRPREARATWEKIVTNFPGTTAASQAQARLSSNQLPVATP
ncbi:MAG: tetratricopeptide repeat protein [Myxococcota bacterium]